jgi:hypothetical protein
MWASRRSSACSQQAVDSLAGHFACPTRGSSLTSSCRGSSKLTCYLTTCSQRATVVVVKSCLDGRAPLSWVGSESGWGSIVRSSVSRRKSIRAGQPPPPPAHTRGRLRGPTGKRKISYEVYAVNVLREASTLEVAIWVIAGDGRLEGATARDVEMWVCHERGPSGLHMQLATELIVLTHELRVFLFELADAQRWWRQGRDLLWRERECRLELGHGLLELYVRIYACVHKATAKKEKKSAR